MTNRDEGSVDAQLARVLAVTDEALAHLELEELLDEMLQRVRGLLAVDTATVLLLEPESQQLVATAAKGLEEEVRQGSRVPVGQGFAGTVAAQRRPVILDHVDSTTVVNPLLVKKHLRSMLGVPLLAAGEVLGVVHVGTFRQREFHDSDVKILQLVADRLALATRSRLTHGERAAVRVLRQSLLPARLPDLPGLEFATRYVPGEHGIGGDWYDVFRLPSRAIVIAIGDVTGHGVAAAVVMGRLRSALRAYALESDNPAEVLSKLDRKVHHFEIGNLATVLYAVLDPSLRTLRLSSAGHLGPARRVPGGHTTLLDVPLGPPVGAVPAKRRSEVLEVVPGTLFCFFSDGLVERRHVPIDDQLELLRASITTTDPDKACVAVMESLVRDQTLEDDLTLLTMRCRESTRTQ